MSGRWNATYTHGITRPSQWITLLEQRNLTKMDGTMARDTFDVNAMLDTLKRRESGRARRYNITLRWY